MLLATSAQRGVIHIYTRHGTYFVSAKTLSIFDKHKFCIVVWYKRWWYVKLTKITSNPNLAVELLGVFMDTLNKIDHSA